MPGTMQNTAQEALIDALARMVHLAETPDAIPALRDLTIARAKEVLRNLGR